jgi:hypothetical protein
MQGSTSMTETANLTFPLVQPAQAQKHVTVNEALARIDGLAQLTLQSVSDPVPPVKPEEWHGLWCARWRSQRVGGAGRACGRGDRRRLGVRAGPARVARHGAGRRADGGFRWRGWRLGAMTLTPGGASLNCAR